MSKLFSVEASKYNLPAWDHNQIFSLVEQIAFYQHAPHHPVMKCSNLISSLNSAQVKCEKGYIE